MRFDFRQNKFYSLARISAQCKYVCMYNLFVDVFVFILLIIFQ